MASLEQLDAVRLQLEKRMVVHEEATVKLQAEMADAQTRNTKINQEQAKIIKDLRDEIKKAQTLADTFHERTMATPVG